ncbi:hypothetical protein ONE63_001359 [Megalurothrips usitatus]|uniref:Uncharacterized protein n=1 Tax=Megalurothrips usitatus TaxID=439358 RepID=A0AAV7XFN6_9NEOP|nr:hypothetical protein ONE63_001359 [Megalurothrips usitatus]
MEEMGRLFDTCNKSRRGDVSVSTLIEAVKKEIRLPDKHGNGPGAGEELLMEVRHILDPLGSDIAVDKATWIAAWRTQAESPKHKRTRNMAGGDIFSPTDIFTDDQCEGILDVSKHSYCFSPGSRSSSVESEPEEVTSLKQENQQLQNCIRTLKERWQVQEDALIQDQTEKLEQEKTFKEEISRLTRIIKVLHESENDLKCTLEICEREKLELCQTVTQLSELDRQQKLKITVQQDEIASFNSEIEELNVVKQRYEQERADLQAELEQQASAHREQIKEYQDAIGMLTAEKNEMNLKISLSLLNRRDVSARLDETQFSSLQSEIAEVEEDGNSADLISENVNGTSVKKNQLPIPQHVLVSSTPSAFQQAKLCNSLRDEMQAAGSFLDSTPELDCSFDVVQVSPVHLSSGLNLDTRQVISQKCNFNDDDRYCRIADKQGETAHKNSFESFGFPQTLSIGHEFEPRNKTTHEKETQTEIVHQEITQVLVPTKDVAAQTDCQASHPIQVLKEQRNEYTQTAIHKRESETQTEFLNQELKQDCVLRQDVDVQTNVDYFEVRRELRNESTQTKVHRCEKETQTEDSSQEARQDFILRQNVGVQTDVPVKTQKTKYTQTRMHKRSSKGESELKTFLDRYKVNKSITTALHNGRETNSDNEELSSLGNVSQPAKLVDEGCRQNDSPPKSSISILDSEKECVHSTVKEDRKDTYLKSAAFLARCGRVAVCLSFIFFLVMASTILFTAAILEEAAASGVLYPPYHGSVPSWIKWIVRPFVRVNRKRYVPM